MNCYRLQGPLKTDAHARVYGDGTETVLIVIDQQGGEPVMAERSFGTGPAASYAASNAARAMKRGTQVTVHGKRLSHRRYHGAQVLVLEAVDYIEHAPAPTHAEPATAEV